MIRESVDADLSGILKLYEQLNNSIVLENSVEGREVWEKICSNDWYHIIVAEENGVIVSSCVCVIIPNLTHNLRSYAVIENVVTDEKYRKRGLATACLDFAKKIAIEEKCYKMMLLTGSKLKSTLKFYELAGYNRQDKTAFIQWL